MINNETVISVYNYFMKVYNDVTIAKLNTSLNLNIPLAYLDNYLT